MPARAITHCSSTRQCAPVTASIAYMRALAITPTSLDGDLSAAHDLAPFCRFVFNHGRDLRRSVRDGSPALSCEFLPHVGLAQHVADLRVQMRDDLGRRPRRRDNAVPRGNIEAGEPRFRERRNL